MSGCDYAFTRAYPLPECPHVDAGAHPDTCRAHADCQPGSDPDTCAYAIAHAVTDSDDDPDPEPYAEPAY